MSEQNPNKLDAATERKPRNAIKERRENGPWILPPPWLPVQYQLADVLALQNLHEGTATPDQQKRAIKFIVREICGYQELGWHPQDAHQASFAAGRRFPALQIEKLVHMDRSLIGGKNVQKT